MEVLPWVYTRLRVCQQLRVPLCKSKAPQCESAVTDITVRYISLRARATNPKVSAAAQLKSQTKMPSKAKKSLRHVSQLKTPKPCPGEGNVHAYNADSESD